MIYYNKILQYIVVQYKIYRIVIIIKVPGQRFGNITINDSEINIKSRLNLFYWSKKKKKHFNSVKYNYIYYKKYKSFQF